MQTRLFSCALALPLVVVACGSLQGADREPERTASRGDAVIYGNDDRTDVYACADPRMRAIATRASVVLVWPPNLDESDPTNVRPATDTPTLGDYKKLCTTEPFRADPAMGSCSGALIDDDLVLTAGHCVPTAQDCADARIVFGWARTSATTLHPMTKDDVFRCTDRLVFRYGTALGEIHDYAIVKLDRPATPRFRPAAVRRAAGSLAVGTSIGIVGYGNGIPAKIDVGARVLDPGGSAVDFFVHTSDAYSGNSGSPVFDMSTYEIAGILARGAAEDFVDAGTCLVNHACPADADGANGCTGMSSDYASKSVEALCANAVHASKYPHLCAKSACGNGRCEASETLASCPADCSPVVDAGGGRDAGDGHDDAGAVAPAEDASAGSSARLRGETATCSASPGPRSGWSFSACAALLLLASRARRRSRG